MYPGVFKNATEDEYDLAHVRVVIRLPVAAVAGSIRSVHSPSARARLYLSLAAGASVGFAGLVLSNLPVGPGIVGAPLPKPGTPGLEALAAGGS